jgi:magnesium transporter
MGAIERHEASGGTRRLPWSGRARPPTVPAPRLVHGMPVTVEHGGVRWINIESPTPVSVAYLRDNFPFHEPDLEDVLDTLQRPQFDEYDDYLWLILQFPVHSKLTRTTNSSEVDIFVGRDYVITLHDTRLKPLVRLFDTVEREPDQREEIFGGGAEYLLHSIIDHLLDYCVPITRRISQRIEWIDDMIFERNSLRVIEEIAIVRRDIIATRRIIKPQVQVIHALDRRIRFFFKQRGDEEEELEAYFGDLVDKIGKVYDILDDAKEVVDSLSATTDSLTSHRLNEVIKILTIFSVIMLPLTLISSVYGMNVHLPLEDHPLSFVYLLIVMVLLAFLMVLFFRWRRWL